MKANKADIKAALEPKFIKAVEKLEARGFVCTLENNGAGSVIAMIGFYCAVTQFAGGLVYSNRKFNTRKPNASGTF